MINNTKMYSKKILSFMIVGLAFVADTFAQDRDGEKTYSFRIVQISDTQPVPGDEEMFQRASRSVELVNRLNPDVVIVPGDITHSGAEDEYKRLKALLETIKAPMHIVPGNHDTIWPADESEKTLVAAALRREKIKQYNTFFGADHWSVEYGDFQFVGFDSTQNWPNLTPQRRNWLRETFLRSEKPYKFMVTHYTFGMARGTVLEDIMASTGVVGYLHGHNHVIQAYEDKNTGIMVFSSGSANFGNEPGNYGVMCFDIYDDSLVCLWIPVEGAARPMGVFNLEKGVSKIARRREIIDIPPYIQQLEQTKVTVKWQTLEPSQSTVVFRKQGDDKWTTQLLKNKSTLHEALIEGLEPGNTYEYYVHVNTDEFGEVKSFPLSFRTPPVQSDSVIFAVYGDSRTQPVEHEMVVLSMVERFGDKLDLCINTGDLVGDGLNGDHWGREFFRPAHKLLAQVPLYPILGNHERNSDYYFDYFSLPGNERWYSFKRGPVHFINLDSYSPLTPGSEQYKWLKQELAGNTSAWRVVSSHAPVFSSGPHGRLDAEGIPREQEIANLQKNIMPLLEEYDVSMVFTGHDHLYERSTKEGTTYVVTGGGGAPLYNAEVNPVQNPYSSKLVVSYHYCIIEANESEFSLNVYSPSGEVLDRLTLRKGGE